MTGVLEDAVTGSPNLNLSNATEFPAGHIIQVQSGSSSTQKYTNSILWNNVGYPVVTITPKKASSNIFLMGNFSGYAGGSTTYALYDFYKNASDFPETYNITGLAEGLAYIQETTLSQHIAMVFLDAVTENSITEKTYKLSLRARVAGNAYIGNFGGTELNTITAFEIAT
jgi:hypothetical protein